MRKLLILFLSLIFVISCANNYNVVGDNQQVKNQNNVILAQNENPQNQPANNSSTPVNNNTQNNNSDIQMVEVDGYGNIFQGEKLIARDAAIKDALRNAVEQVVGTMISSSSKVQNYQLIEDNIYSKSQGFVQKYEIISEDQKGDTYHVKIRAYVSKNGIKDKLMALHLLMVQKNMPRVVIFLKQNLYGDGWSYYGDSNSMAEEKLKEEFINKGFMVIDLATRKANINRTSLIAATDGDLNSAKKLALMLNADLIITGKVVGNVKNNSFYGGYLSAHLDVSLKAIKADTGEIIASSTKSRSLAPVSDKISGINKVVDILIPQVADNLITGIMTKWSSTSNYVHITLKNISYSDVRKFTNFLRERVRFINNVYKRGFTSGVAEIDVDTQKSGEDLADEISLREDALPFKINIVDVTNDSITLEKVNK